MALQKIKEFTDYNHYPEEASPTTDADMQDYMGNQNDILKALTKRLWQPLTAYSLGDIVMSDSMADGLVAVCVIAGTTTAVEPTWVANEETVVDGTCTWIMRPAYCYGLATETDVENAYNAGNSTEDETVEVEPSHLMSMGIFAKLMACVDAEIQRLKLVAYPIGSLYWSKNPTNPAELFGGTWTQIKDKFILAAGDSYAVGATGGAATVTLTTAQMPAHTHNASTNSTGAHTHSINVITQGSDQNAGDGGDNYWTTRNTSSAGAHSHTVTVNSAGSSQSHENMPPFVTYYCWERTA